jgi:hypothetical protein
MRYVRRSVETYNPDLLLECGPQSYVQWWPRMPGDHERPDPPPEWEELLVCVRNSPGEVGTTITTTAEERVKLEAAIRAEGGTVPDPDAIPEWVAEEMVDQLIERAEVREEETQERRERFSWPFSNS